MMGIVIDERHCVRCGADVHPPDPPHLCKDLAKRLERQQKAIAMVTDILVMAGTDDSDPIEAHREVAERIVEALAGRDLGT